MKNQKETIKIYALRNTQNDKVYIGSSKNIDSRCKPYHYTAKKIAAAIEDIGWENFHIEVLAETPDPIKASHLEFHYILQFNAIEDGYNSNLGSFRRTTPLKWSKETNDKRSAAMKKLAWIHTPDGQTFRTRREYIDVALGFGYLKGRKDKEDR